MMTSSRRSVFAKAGALALTLMAAFTLASCEQKGASAGDIVLGDPKAPIKIVEYASVTCGHCREFHEEVFPTLKRDWIDTGKATYVMREFRTPPADIASAGFLMARCAAKGDAKKYYDIIATLFERQPAIFQALQGGRAREELINVAREAGMTDQEFDTCLADKVALKALMAVEEEGSKTFKITGTPTLIINGEAFRPQRYTAENVVDQLNKASK
jgi:protein-disulfide isomerase